MKKIGRRLTALALALVAALGMMGQTAFASLALGTELAQSTVPLAEGVTLTNQSLWSASKGDLRTENYITYTPGGQVKPVVFSGNYVASTNTVASAAAQLKAQGYRVAAALNGGFFNTDGTIVGMLMTDGVVRSLDVENYAMLGFTSDGRVFIDESTVVKKVSWQQPSGWNFTASLAGYNAYRHHNYTSEAFLYNNDFSTKVNSATKNVSAILRPVDSGVMKMNSSLAMEVVSVADTAQEGVSFNGYIPEGCYMLYAEYHSGNEWLTNGIRELVPGQRVTVSVSGVSDQWNSAAYGISGLYPLLRNGQVVSGLPTAANPYTAVGIKADGTAIFYTIDGRQAGYSVGATYAQVAQRLQELGCVTAVALDGGGSTNLGATLPGTTDFAIQNKPSQTGRRVNNSILLVMPDNGPTGELAGSLVSAPQNVALVGAEVPLSTTPYDTAGYPMPSHTAVWSSDGGIVRETDQGPVFSSIVPGTFTISAGPNGAGALTMRVVDTLSTLRVTREGSSTAVSSLSLKPGDTVNLSASATWSNLPVALDDGVVAWRADAAIGAIDANGNFKASDGRKGAKGNITVSAGGRTVTIPVTVQSNYPFTDIASHWSADYVDQLYSLNLTNGYTQPDGTAVFRPNNQLTRGELLTFICRLLNVDTSKYGDTVLPFADAGSIDSWLLPYVKSMYALGVLDGTSRGGKLYADVKSNVTREAAMTMLGRVLASQVKQDLSGFADGGSVSSWARPYVETLVGQGVVEGSNGKLNPQAHITRGEAAKLLAEVNELDKATLTLRPAAPGNTGSAPNQQPGVDPGGTFVDPTQRPELPSQGKPDDKPFDPNFDPSDWNLDWPLFNQ